MKKKCMPLSREEHFQVKILKKIRVINHYWRDRCRKRPMRLQAAVQIKIYKIYIIFGPFLEDPKVHAIDR